MRPDFAALAAALAVAGCGEANGQGPASSVTVKLPPPRPAVARPGFSGLLDERPAAIPQRSAS